MTCSMTIYTAVYFLYLYSHGSVCQMHRPITRFHSFTFTAALILRFINATRWWKHSSEVLVNVDLTASHSCCWCVGFTSTIGVSCISTSQRCSVWLRSGECGCRLSTANTSHVQETSEIIWSFWYVVLSYWKEPSEVRYTVLIKRWTWSTVFRQMCKQMLNQKLRVRRPADGLLKRPGNSP